MLSTEAVPLVMGADGVIRVRDTRVTLDTVLAAFGEGATAEEIAQQYPSITLADAYQAIGYYLRHTSEIEGYLLGRDLDVRKAKESNESKFAPGGVRERLMTRKQG